MRTHLLAAVAVAAISGLVGYGTANLAGAQGAPAIQATGDTPAQAAAGGRDGGGWAGGGWRNAPDGRWGRYPGVAGGPSRLRQMAHARGWGLFYPQADKKLSVADVTTLAQAILVRHGNHTWKVTEVVQNPDNTVSFAFATDGGGVIARFAMDTQTGRLRRTG